LLALAVPAAAECPGITLQTVNGSDSQPRILVGLPDGDRRFILDTGAPMSTLRESVVEALHLPHLPMPLDVASGVTGRPFQERTLVAHLDLGGIGIDNVGFLIEPRSHAEDPERAGLIGADLFARFDLDLELGVGRIRLLAPGSCRPSGMVPVEVQVQPSRHVLVPFVLDGVRVTGLLDSGASRSILLFDAAHRMFGLDPSGPGIRQIGEVTGADGGRMPAYAHGFGALVLGPATLDRPDILLVGDETRREHRPLTGADGSLPPTTAETGLPDFILGMSSLRRLHLIMSYRDRVLYVAPAEGPK
jgi:hypothetical protein